MKFISYIAKYDVNTPQRRFRPGFAFVMLLSDYPEMSFLG
jgi:hypothetical protein